MANKRFPLALFIVLLGLSTNLAAGQILFQVVLVLLITHQLLIRVSTEIDIEFVPPSTRASTGSRGSRTGDGTNS
jgi:hypothetical protein